MFGTELSRQESPQTSIRTDAMSSLITKLLVRPRTYRFLLQQRFYAANAGSKENIEKIVGSDKVVVFMKGDPAQPMCGFSNAVVQILRMHGVENYTSHNVLDDEDLRQGIKEYTEWPTIPQIFFNGEFIGGCDIMLQMHQNGDLVEELEKLGIRSALLDSPQDETKS